ncbi:MAG TPA: SigE family RNA polymerase sigma factor [Actinomycetota bacterium]|nr:SigE family RNA polymerase sigma factor [Actinomycetota bacterium]
MSRPGIGDLYLQHAATAVRLAYLLTGDRALAEDLVQDAFVRLAGRLVHLRDPEAFDTYLRTTVVNLSRSHFRRKAVERGYLEKAKGEAAMSHSSTPDRSIEIRDELWHALRRLSHRQRAAIVLRFYEDLPEAEVASILECAPGTVKSLVSRGLDKLRYEIGGDEL